MAENRSRGRKLTARFEFVRGFLVVKLLTGRRTLGDFIGKLQNGNGHLAADELEKQTMSEKSLFRSRVS